MVKDEENAGDIKAAVLLIIDFESYLSPRLGILTRVTGRNKWRSETKICQGKRCHRPEIDSVLVRSLSRPPQLRIVSLLNNMVNVPVR